MELHDELGQALTATSINLAAIEKEIAGNGSEALINRLNESIELTAVALDQVREMSLNLRPPMLDDLGLVPTLRWYGKRFAERVGVKTKFKISSLDYRLSPEMETTLYRIVQEALTNVARHAQATKVILSLRMKNNKICAVIADNGQGFDLETRINGSNLYEGAGLLGIRERVTLLGGEFDIQTGLDQGTTLTITMPTQEWT